MILAAGRGERMRPLTDDCPKPLLEVGDAPLIVHQIRALARAGFRELIINTSYRAAQIHQVLGDGQQWQVRIQYSDEGESALETGGGIVRALPLLGNNPFLVVNGDVWCDYPWQRLRQLKTNQGHLILVDNPSHHPAGDFSLHGLRPLTGGEQTLTYAGIGVFHPGFFKHCEPGRYPLGPMLRAAAQESRLTAEHYRGEWRDIGSVERLDSLRAQLAAKSASC